MMEILAFVATGMFIGVLSGLLGIGGGVALVPILVIFFLIEQHMAQGISMFFIIPTALSGMWAMRGKGLLDTKITVWIALGSAIGILLSANFVQYVPSYMLKKVFGFFLLYFSYKMIFAKKKT